MNNIKQGGANMNEIEFFKKESKKFLKDWKHGTCKYYNANNIVSYYLFDDELDDEPKLQKAQHIIANMCGFKKWNDLIHASDKELKQAESHLRRIKEANK